MPIHTARQSPAMTLHSGRGHAGPSRASASRAGGSTNAAQSLSDLYNARHAQESNASSSSSSSRNASSSSLVDLYNKRHDVEVRRTKTSSSSLADLYNQRYENEHRDKVDSVEEVLPAHHQLVNSRSRRLARPVAPSAPASQKTIPRAISVDESSDEGTPEPASLMPSESDELGDEENALQHDDVVNLSSTPTWNGRDQSQTRSESSGNLQESAELVYVARSSIPRRGALSSSATRLTMDSDEEMDTMGTPEPEFPQESGSSIAALARPHPSPSKLIVPSSESVALDPESGLSTPPIPPHHRKGKNVPHPLLTSTQEDESLTSILGAESGAESTRAVNEHVASTSTRPRPLSCLIGSSDEVVVLSDSSSDNPIRAMGSASSRPTHSEAESRPSARSSPERTPSPMDVDTIVMLRSPTKTMRQGNAAEQTSLGTDSHRASLSKSLPSLNPGVVPSGRDSVIVDDSRSNAPIVADPRFAESQAAETSANATESESEAQRSRYPRRARNVTDYNVRRAFERYERAQDQDNEPVPRVLVRSKKARLPVVEASPDFFEALRSQKANKSANAGQAPPSFADFLMSRTKPSSAAGSSSSTTSPSGHNAGPSATLTEIQVRALLKPVVGPETLCKITVDTQDRASLFQLKPSTRRWLGIKGPDPLQPDSDSSDDDNVESPPLPGTGTPIGLRLGSIIPTHRRRDKISPAELRDRLDSLEGAGRIGRPVDATVYESASRRLRLGRACKLPLPDSLRAFADMEHEEWVRLEEYLPEISRMVEEQQAREQGRILVEMDNSDSIQTQYDHLGRKRVSTMQLVTGGQLKVYFDVESSDPVVPEDESQGYEIVRTRSPARSPSTSRLASVRPLAAGEEERGEEGEEGAEELIKTPVMEPADRSSPSADTPEPILPSEATSRHQVVPASKTAQTTQAQHGVRRKAAEPQPTLKKNMPAVASPSKPKATTSKGTRDLLSYFGRQSSPSQPSSNTASASKTASSSKVATPSATKPAPAARSSRAPKSAQLANSAAISAVQKGKQRALDLDIQAWPSSSLSTDSEVEVVIDLTQPSSTAESVAKLPRSPSPPTGLAKKKKAAVGEAKVVGLGSKAEGRKRDERQAVRTNEDAAPRRSLVPVVELPAAPPVDSTAKRKRASSPLDLASTPPLIVSRPPQPTPSPTRGGWKGISGWYTNTRGAFSPTPEGGARSDRELAKRQRQAKLDSLLVGKRKHK